MKPETPESPARAVVSLLITAAVGIAVGHVLTVERVYEPSLTRAPGEGSSPYPRWPQERPLPTPLLRSNDRSRWCTVRALVDDGTYVIGHLDLSHPGTDRPFELRGIVSEDGWQTVDKVLKPGTDELYSSKPPLLPTLVAGEYWLLKHAFGWSLAGNAPSRWWVVRVVLLTFNVLPLAVYLVLLDRLVASLGATDWARAFVLTTACFATFVTPFMGALNNHTVAACSVVFALAPAFRAAFGGPQYDRPWRYAAAGFFAAFAATVDLPAAAFAAALLVVLFVHSPRKTLLVAVPAAAVPVAGLLLCNYLAIGQLTPAYGELGGPWYVYPGSNFNPNAPPELRRGVDWALEKESYPVYLLHFFLGHHGLFSLTPVWLLAVAGMFAALATRGGQRTEVAPLEGRSVWRRWGERRTLAAVTLLVSIIVTAFYLLKTRNYGGWTIGPRWLMWLTPLWLLVMVPVADRLGRSRVGRGVALVLLGLSALSAVVPAGSPWHHPWIYTVLEQWGGPLY